MRLTLDTLRAIAKGPVNVSNATSVLKALDRFGADAGLDREHRLAQFLAQLMHESGAFKWDKEIWGPTPAQKRYEGRADLGNVKKGDGRKFSGRGPIQLTGRANVTAFYEWCVRKGYNPPNFVDNPELLNTDPWEGLTAIWYWDIGNPTGKSLNVYADQGDIETITKRVNGGMNGFSDRVTYFMRAGLVMLGMAPTAIKEFQRDQKLDVDGDPGPKTRAALHMALVKLDGKRGEAKAVRAAPVTVTEEVSVPVAVTPKSMDAPWWKSKETWVPAITGGGLTGGLATVGGMPFENLIVIVVALIVAGGVLLYLKNRDAKQVDKAVERLT